MSGSMSGVWKQGHGRTSEAPPDERGGNGYVRPATTAPHLDSTYLVCSVMSAIGPLTPQLLPNWCGAANRRDVPVADRDGVPSLNLSPNTLRVTERTRKEFLAIARGGPLVIAKVGTADSGLA